MNKKNMTSGQEKKKKKQIREAIPEMTSDVRVS